MAPGKNKNVILLPIFPQYANAIMEGRKKIEFRKKNIPTNIEFVVIYSTKPEKKVIGLFKVETITKAHPKILWDNFKDIGCVKKEFLFDYYDGHDQGVAIHVGRTYEFSQPFNLSDLNDNLNPPQSFRYLKNDEWKTIKKYLNLK